MNKRGMTLIEVVTAIMVLSLASLMIISGFVGVFRFIGKANDVQYGSDALLSYAEKTTDDTQRDQVKGTIIPNTKYTIKTDKGKIVDVISKINVLDLYENDAVSLRVLKREINTIVGKTPEFQTLKERAAYFMKYITEITGSYPPNNPYDAAFKVLFIDRYNQKWDPFENALLPKALQNTTASGALPYNLVGYFPWEDYSSMTSIDHGDLMLYLSQTYRTSEPGQSKEVLHIVYDYKTYQWFYYPENDYVLDYDAINRLSYTKNGTTEYISSYTNFMLKIKEKGSGWYVLDEKAEFREHDPDSFWVAI